MANQKQLTLIRQGSEIWNAWRARHQKISINLSGADLSETFLSRTNLSYANLNGTNLSEANLNGTDLSRATLSRANFSGANLSNANLNGANCYKATFVGASLIGATLTRSDLGEANFSKAQIGWTTWGTVDFRTVKGLETIRHLAPSTIGIDTIYHSHDTIPERFLREVGVPEPFITYMHALVASLSPIQFHSCFLSYTHEDQPFAERLYADLQQQGIRCWYAPKDLKTGDYFHDKIDRSIHTSDKLLLVLSKNSIKSRWVEQEVNRALEKEDTLDPETQVLFPLRLDDAVLQTRRSWASTVGFLRHILDFTNWQDPATYQQAFTHLLQDLKKSAEGPAP